MLSTADWTAFKAKVAPDDARLSDARAPLPGSASYIQDSPLAPQTASFSITGDAAVGGIVTANTFSGDGSLLTGLDATHLTGTVSDQRLSGNICRADGNNVFTGSNTFAGTQGFASLTASGDVTARAFIGDGGQLGNLGLALVGGVGSATLAQALQTAGNGDALKVKGVPIDDAAKADGYVLAFNAQSGHVEYHGIPSGAPPPPVVPASVSWSIASSGNAQCAVAKGVCTQASGSGTSQACGATTSSGTASCTQSGSIDKSVVWTAATTGDAACRAAVANCAQAYNETGSAIACNSSSPAGSAACFGATAAQGWDTLATWNSSYTQSGTFACEVQGADCVQAYNASGDPVACASQEATGSARCLTPQPGAAWDRAATWNNTSSSGYIECGRLGKVCIDVAYAGPSYGTYPCDSEVSASGYTVVARCRATQPGDGWNTFATWNNASSSGYIECAKINASCVEVAYAGPSAGTYPCESQVSASGYTVLAHCLKHQPSDPWDTIAQWNNTVSSGIIGCTKVNANCVDVGYAGPSAGTSPCNANTGGSGYDVLARCKTRSAGDPWNAYVEWVNVALFGNVQCALINAECVDTSYAGPSGGSYPCNLAVSSAGYTVVARCLTATLAGAGWNTQTNWSGLAQTGAAACTAIGGTCVSVLGAGDGTTHACTDSIAQGVAKCAK